MSNPRVCKIRRRAKLTRRLYGPVSRSTFRVLFFILLTTALYSGSFAAISKADAKRVAAVLPGSSAALLMLAAPQLTEEAITLYAADSLGNCTATQTTSFKFGDKVCAKIDGGPDLGVAPRSLIFSSPDGVVLQNTEVTALGQMIQFTIPARDANDFREVWRVTSVSPWYQARTSTSFTVSDPGDATANLTIYNNITFDSAALSGGQQAEYTLWIVNRGPDNAANVAVAITGSNSTFVSATQTLGPTPSFDCTTTPGTCTAASLPVGAKAAIKLISQANGSPGTLVSTTATITSATPDARLLDNSSTASAIVSVQGAGDTCSLNCPNDITITATHEVGGQPGANVEFEGESAGDCGTLEYSHASGSFFPAGTTDVTIEGANGGSCTFRVHVIDSSTLPAPTITCAADQSVGASAGAVDATVNVTAPTTGGTVLSVVGVRSDGVSRQVTDPYSVGETTITWTARDQAADDDGQFPPLTRSASCTQKITVTSADAPTISCSTDKTYDAAANSCERTLSSTEIGEPTTTGTGVEVEGVRSDRRPLTDPFSVGTTIITWTATDSVGRIVSCTHTITIRATGSDNTPPVLNMPDDVEVTTSSCTAVVDDELGVATAIDSCGGGVQITRTGVPTGPVVIRRRFPLPPLIVQRETFIFPVGTTILTYTATDASGNVTTKTQKVVVKEDPAILPTITAPPDITANADAGSCSAVIALGTPATGDNCGVASVTNDAPSTFPVGTTTVTWTVTDKSGNKATDVQDVTVIDNQNPTVTAPEDKTFYTGANPASCGVTVSNSDLGTATADDNCPGVMVARDGGNTFPVGETIITYTATDAHGRTATDTQKVTVVDNTPPVITTPANITVYLPLNSTDVSRPVTYSAATATDNCGQPITVNHSHASGSVFPVGTTTITVSATDSHNNKATATFTVTVLYNFTGFFQPVDNLPVLNSVNAGRAIPVKFSLSGNKGLGIFAANSPYTVALDCGSGASVDVEETLTAGSSSLTYNSTSDQYHYVWKTESSWAGTCRQLVVKLNDGSEHRANFKFK